MDTNKKKDTSPDSFDDIDQKIHANQVLYDQLHQSLVDEVLTSADDSQAKENKVAKSSFFEKSGLIKISEYLNFV